MASELTVKSKIMKVPQFRSRKLSRIKFLFYERVTLRVPSLLIYAIIELARDVLKKKSASITIRPQYVLSSTSHYQRVNAHRGIPNVHSTVLLTRHFLIDFNRYENVQFITKLAVRYTPRFQNSGYIYCAETSNCTLLLATVQY